MIEIILFVVLLTLFLVAASAAGYKTAAFIVGPEVDCPSSVRRKLTDAARWLSDPANKALVDQTNLCEFAIAVETIVDSLEDINHKLRESV